MTSRLCIVTAFAAESRPFLDRWPFKAQQNTRRVRTYAHDRYLLLQTGQGKLKAAASVSAVLQANPDVNRVVNVGIAGADRPIGSLQLAHKIKDEATGYQWYPHLPDPRSMPAAVRQLTTTTVLTLDHPGSNYQPGIAYDMEAAGIFSAATSYLTTNQIHSIKLVSDNPETPIETLKKQSAHWVSTLIQERFAEIEALLECLYANGQDHSLAHRQWVLINSQRLAENVHHSQTEEVLLKRLLERMRTLDCALDMDYCMQLGSADAIRKHLEHQLSLTNLSYAST